MYDWNPRTYVMQKSFIHDLIWNPFFGGLSKNAFALSFKYTYNTLTDAWMKKDKHVVIQKIYLDPK